MTPTLMGSVDCAELCVAIASAATAALADSTARRERADAVLLPDLLIGMLSLG